MTHDATKGAPAVGWALILLLGGAAALVVFIAAFLWAIKKSPAVLVVLAAIAGLGTIAAVWTVISGTPSMWPSPVWRFAGGAINVFGVVGAAGCVAVRARTRRILRRT